MEAETITQLAKRLGKNRRTVWLWVTRGVTVGAQTVRLPASKVGFQWTVSAEQYAEFVRRCNPGQHPLPESPAAEKKRFAAEKAAALKKLGGG